MKNKWIIVAIITGIIIGSTILYEKATDDTYVGMSIIPEQHKDIPLLEGLKPTRNAYLIDGNRWEEIFAFYKKELPKHGWKVEYVDSALNDQDKENDWAGFYSYWSKGGVPWELTVSSSYNEYDEYTKVMFDKNPTHSADTWISEAPERICIYKQMDDEKCSEITDAETIEGIVRFINKASDRDNEIELRKQSSVMEVGDLRVLVHYERDKEIYFQSNEGIKIMKPDPDFFQLTNLSQFNAGRSK